MDFEHSDKARAYIDLAERFVRERVLPGEQTYFDQLNATLASYETVKKFAVLPRELSLEGGELTPSLKVKRKVVEAKHQALLDGFYSAPAAL